MYQILGYTMYEKRVDDCKKGVVRIYLSEVGNKYIFKVIDIGYKNKERYFKIKEIKNEDCTELRFISKDKKKKFVELPSEITWEWCIENFSYLKVFKNSIELYKSKVVEGALCYDRDPIDLQIDIAESGLIVDLFNPEVVVEDWRSLEW